MQNIDISTTYLTIKAKIAAAELAYGRPAGSVQLLAVSKKQPVEKIQILAHLGQQDFGESYVQEALVKIAALSDLALTWHFIGPIQSNKTKAIAQHFHWVHSVDRISIAQRLSRQRSQELPPLNICLQANMSAESRKSGFRPDQIIAAVDAVRQLPNLTLRGLMVIPAPSVDFAVQRQMFAQAYDLYQSMQRSLPHLDTLSMGMSGDLDAAIAEHSGWVRIGTALFGRRE